MNTTCQGAAEPVEIRGLSLTQPWATLVATGAKRIETRSWTNHYRGWLAIHAAKGLESIGGIDGLKWQVQQEPFRRAVMDVFPAGVTYAEAFPLGAIVAVVQLHDIGRIVRRADGAVIVKRQPVEGDELAFGDYTAGRFGWRFTNIWRLSEPVQCRGALGVWVPPPDVVAQIEAQLPVPLAQLSAGPEHIPF